MTGKIDHIKEQARQEDQDVSAVNAMEQYWLWYLKNTKEGKREISKIKRLYPTERSIIIPLPSITGQGANDRFLGILRKPGAEIEVIEWAYSQILTDKKYRDIRIKFTHLPKITPISSIRLEDEDTLIAIRGIIKKASDIRKRCTLAVFKCKGGHFTSVPQGWGQFREPTTCDNEGCQLRKFDFIAKRSKFEDFQRLSVLENSETQRGGDQPRSISVELSDDLCGILLPGDVVTLNGKIKSYQIITRGIKSVDFGYYFQLNSFDPIQRDYDEVQISEEELERIKEVARKDPLTQIAQSIAPSIYGMGEIKRACALQLVGGNSWRDDSGHIQRGDIHIMLCMDPGVAKSELLRQIVRYSPRGIYTNARSSSAAGLTVTVSKDESDGRWTAEAGAACLADLGICAVDELNLLHKNEQSSLHEVMESQQVHVAKAGLVCMLNARTAMLMALNPKLGRFDMWDAGTLLDQIDISAPLMSRFDLIFIKSDQPEHDQDLNLARHISRNRLMAAKRKNKTITDEELKTISPPLSTDFLRKYFAYAKMQPAPEISPEAQEILDSYYATERGKATPGTVPFTARTHEAAHRLAEASARLRLSKTVTKKDAETAIILIQISASQVCTDPKTGKVDYDRIAGTPKSNRDLARNLLIIIGELTLEKGQTVTRDIFQRLSERKIPFSDIDVERILEKLKQTGDLMENHGIWTVMKAEK